MLEQTRRVITFVLAISLFASGVADASAALARLMPRQNPVAVNFQTTRFLSPDALDPTLPGVGTNRYAYAQNNPINMSDPTGHASGIDDAIALGLGAVGGLVIQAGTDLWNGDLSGWQDYVASGVAGAVAGEVALHAGYVSGGTLSAAAAGAAFGATHAATRSLLYGEAPSLSEVAVEAGVGAIGGAAGGFVGVAASNALAPITKGRLGEALSYGKATLSGRFGLVGQEGVRLPGPGPRRTVVDWTYGPASAQRYIEAKFGYSARLSPAQRKAQDVFGQFYQVDRWTPDHIGSMMGVEAGATTTLDANSDRDTLQGTGGLW